MKIVADLHTHSGEVCGHASGTLDEMCRQAADIGLLAIANTDHGPLSFDGLEPQYYLDNLKKPESLHGVRLYKGIEIDIRDYSGGFLMDTADMLKLDWVVASMHGGPYTYGNREQNTAAYLGALENPAVDCLGHIARGNYPCDFGTVIAQAKRLGRTVEVNNHTFDFGDTDTARCRDIAQLCMKYELAVVVTSDAHSVEAVGGFSSVLDFLASVNFPVELVINACEDRLSRFLEQRVKQKSRLRIF